MTRESAGLGEFETLVLLAVLRTGRGEAYGVTLKREIESRSGRPVSRGAVYVTLERLERKGYLRSRVGGATAVRGGRRKRLYEIRPAGLAALRSALAALGRMREGLEPALGDL